MLISHVTAIAISGISWFLMGFFLLSKGLNLFVHACYAKDTGGLISHIAAIAGGREQAALFLMMVGLGIGYLKGKVVLVKTVKRVAERVISLPNPLKITQMYAKSYYILLLSMMAIAALLRFSSISNDIRGIIDVAIGAALVKGSLLYLRFALAVRKQRSIENG